MATLTKRGISATDVLVKKQRALSALFAFADSHYTTDPNFKFNRAECYER